MIGGLERVGKTRLVKVDEEFYNQYKKSGYTMPTFSKKMLEKVFTIEMEKEKKKKEIDFGGLLKL